MYVYIYIYTHTYIDVDIDMYSCTHEDMYRDTEHIALSGRTTSLLRPNSSARTVRTTTSALSSSMRLAARASDSESSAGRHGTRQMRSVKSLTSH